MSQSFRSSLYSMWDEIDLHPSTKPREKNTGWGKQYIDKLVDELVELKAKAKEENNPALYEQLRISLIRAHEVQKELREKE